MKVWRVDQALINMKLSASWTCKQNSIHHRSKSVREFGPGTVASILSVTEMVAETYSPGDELYWTPYSAHQVSGAIYSHMKKRGCCFMKYACRIKYHVRHLNFSNFTNFICQTFSVTLRMHAYSCPAATWLCAHS